MSDLSEADYVSEAKRRLAIWGAEDYRQRQLGGFAHQTLEAIAQQYKMIPRAAGMKKEAEKPEILDTDAIVTRLKHQPNGEDMVLALRLFYCARKRFKDEHGVWHDDGRWTQEDVALTMKRSRASVRSLLDSAHSFVAGALSWVV